MTCRDCKHLIVPGNKLGQRRPRKGFTYNCEAPIPMPKLPDSVRLSYGFKWPPNASYMEPDAGANCPCHEPLN